MTYHQISKILLLCFFGITFFILASPAQAVRVLEWRDDGLWVITNGEESHFYPLSGITVSGWQPRIELSPDSEWVTYVKQTGGGFENEGQSLFIARWNGEDERVLLETDWLIPNIYWLEGIDTYYVAIQKMSGGTMFGSHFALVDFQTGDVITQVEGMIYKATLLGARQIPTNLFSKIGLRYEVLGHNEEPIGWGAFYVDELIDYPIQSEILQVDDLAPEDHPLTDGQVAIPWIARSEDFPSARFSFSEGSDIRGICIQSGWQWHQPPDVEERGWEAIDLWRLYDRPKSILLGFSDGLGMEVELDDTRSVQWIYFEEGVPLDSVTLTVTSVYRGIEFDSVAISEIYVF